MLKPTTTIKAAALIAALYLPAQAGDTIRIYVDGQKVGTLANLEYRLEQGEIHITTHERVVGCRQDRVLWDRFE